MALVAKALAGSDGAAGISMTRAFEVLAKWCAGGGAEAALAVMALATEAVSVDTRRWAVMMGVGLLAILMAKTSRCKAACDAESMRVALGLVVQPSVVASGEGVEAQTDAAGWTKLSIGTVEG